MNHSLKFLLTLLLLAAGHAFAQTDSEHEPSGDRFVLGAFIGSPSGIGAAGGLYLGPLAVRVSGASLGHGTDGIEGDIGIALTKSDHLIQDISVVAGSYHTSVSTTAAGGGDLHTTQRFVGAAYGVYYSGFFLQAGLGKGTGDFPNPELIYRFGYLFSF